MGAARQKKSYVFYFALFAPSRQAVCQPDKAVLAGTGAVNKLNMKEKINLDKDNFLTWYEMATEEDIKKAKSTNKAKYQVLLAKYKTKIEEINLKKSIRTVL